MLKKTFIVFALFSLFMNSAAAQKVSDTTTLMTVNGQKVTVEEFNYIYSKNNQKNKYAYTQKDLDEYMKLFINFKLKVLEAERLGLDTNPAFITELKGYEKQLAKPYLTEDSVIDALTKQAYERMQTEVRAAHILILVDENASPEDTLKAYKKISSIRKSIVEGKDFGKTAFEKSEDPSAKINNGDLGYFRALNMVYPFEEAAYTTPVGTVSEPFRTSFGYHILKVTDKRPSQGTVTAAHIMINAKSGISSEDSLAAKRKVDEIYTKLIADPSQWNTLCTQFSDHGASKNNNGELKPFETGNPNLPAEFKETAFKLEKEGDISAPFKSPYGWHIVKLISKTPLDPFDKMEYEIRNRVMRDSRSALSEKVLIKKLKKENDVVEYAKNFTTFLSFANDDLISGTWKYTPTKKSGYTLFTINGEKYSIEDALTYIQSSQKPSKANKAEEVMKKYYETFLNKSILQYEEDHLTEKYSDYRLLVKEYRDGILLFQLMDDLVWSKAVKDTSGLKKYYEANKTSYMWVDRIDATIYDLGEIDKLKKLKKDIAKGRTKNELLEKYNKTSTLTLQITSNIFNKEDNAMIDNIAWKVGSYEVPNGDRIAYIVVDEVLPPQPKAFNEARGLIISDYQSQLEKEWLAELKARYPVKVNDNVLKQLIK